LEARVFGHLLVPLDGSRLAETALPAAAELARRLRASVTLLHVLEPDAPPTVHGDRHLRSPAEAEGYLAGAADWMAARQVSADVALNQQQGDVAATIARLGAAGAGAGLGWMRVVPSVDPVSGDQSAPARLLPTTAAAMLEVEAAEAGSYLERIAGGMRQEGRVVATAVGRGDPVRVLADAVRQRQVDLMVMATHGRSGVSAVWAGSVASG